MVVHLAYVAWAMLGAAPAAMDRVVAAASMSVVEVEAAGAADRRADVARAAAALVRMAMGGAARVATMALVARS